MPVEDQGSINEWIETTFGTAGSNLSVASRANQEMAELLMALAVDDHHPKAVEEAADIVIILFRLAQREGKDLMEEVNRKMAVNRERRWNVANGHGYHEGSITASCGHVLEDGEDTVTVMYKSGGCDAVDGFYKAVSHASFCPRCAKEWAADGELFATEADADAWLDAD